jgi:hypothetical protein
MRLFIHDIVGLRTFDTSGKPAGYPSIEYVLF